MRLLIKTIGWLVFAALLGVAALALVVHERGGQLEAMIERAAAERGIDPRLFAALVSHSGGTRTTAADGGRYGLLLLTEADGRAWAAAGKERFDTFDLFDPEKNLRIGAWRFDAGLRAWAREKEAAVWAVAGWNTNRETVRAWADAARGGTNKAVAYITDLPLRIRVRDTIIEAQIPKPFALRLPPILQRLLEK